MNEEPQGGGAVVATTPETTEGMMPQPGTSKPEVPAIPGLASEAQKPADPLNPLAPVGTPGQESLSATHDLRQEQKVAAAQQEKPGGRFGWFKSLIPISVETKQVTPSGQNAVPEHLTQTADGKVETPAMTNLATTQPSTETQPPTPQPESTTAPDAIPAVDAPPAAKSTPSMPSLGETPVPAMPETTPPPTQPEISAPVETTDQTVTTEPPPTSEATPTDEVSNPLSVPGQEVTASETPALETPTTDKLPSPDLSATPGMEVTAPEVAAPAVSSEPVVSAPSATVEAPADLSVQTPEVAAPEAATDTPAVTEPIAATETQTTDTGVSADTTDSPETTPPPAFSTDALAPKAEVSAPATSITETSDATSLTQDMEAAGEHPATPGAPLAMDTQTVTENTDNSSKWMVQPPTQEEQSATPEMTPSSSGSVTEAQATTSDPLAVGPTLTSQMENAGQHPSEINVGPDVNSSLPTTEPASPSGMPTPDSSTAPLSSGDLVPPPANSETAPVSNVLDDVAKIAEASGASNLTGAAAPSVENPTAAEAGAVAADAMSAPPANEGLPTAPLGDAVTQAAQVVTNTENANGALPTGDAGINTETPNNEPVTTGSGGGTTT